MTPNDTQNPATAPADGSREHLRPVRSAREVRLPLAVRKELLITRAALERYDFAESMHTVRYQTQRFTRLSAWLPRMGGRSKSLVNMLGLAKDYPLLSSLVSLSLPLLRKTPLLRWTWKASKLGLLAGAGYWAFDVWRRMQQPKPKVPDAGPFAGAPGAPQVPLDTGFRDPLVR
jgi:hypothetical protein